jgi:hypothetical protein
MNFIKAIIPEYNSTLLTINIDTVDIKEGQFLSQH